MLQEGAAHQPGRSVCSWPVPSVFPLPAPNCGLAPRLHICMYHYRHVRSTDSSNLKRQNTYTVSGDQTKTNIWWLPSFIYSPADFHLSFSNRGQWYSSWPSTLGINTASSFSTSPTNVSYRQPGSLHLWKAFWMSLSHNLGVENLSVVPFKGWAYPISLFLIYWEPSWTQCSFVKSKN